MQGKVAIITGASSGIGKAVTKLFVSQRVKTVLVGRNEPALKQTLDEIKKLNGESLSIVADVTSPNECENIVNTAVDKFGKLDVIVNSAGIIANGTIENTSLQLWDDLYNINVRSIFCLMQLGMPHLIKTKGNVVNVSSVNGYNSFPNTIAYCSSKAALNMLTRCAALEMASRGVRVNAVCPGVVITQLHKRGGMAEDSYLKFLEHSKETHPLGRVGHPEEIADLILFLASPHASWITGTTLPIDGGRGQTCLR